MTVKTANALEAHHPAEAFEDGSLPGVDYAEQLIALQEVSLELSLIDSLDELCRRAVEMAITRLGFERLGLFMLDPADNQYLLGMFGTDEQGHLRDERHNRVRIAPDSGLARLVARGFHFSFSENSTLQNDKGAPVGKGSKAQAALWDGKRLIGIIATDNLLSHRPISQRQLSLLDVFARTVGHLLTLKLTQQQLRRSNRALRALSECNQLMIRVNSEAGLFNGLCELLVQIGGYRRSWLTLEEPETGARLVAQSGEETPLPTAWVEAGDAARRTGQLQVCPGAAEAVAAVPLPLAAPATGCLHLWAAEADRFDAEEIALLAELAGDIAYGLHTLRLRARQQQAEAAIRQLNERLEQRVVERTTELEAANRELEAFSYSISHDLRSPLRSLDGFSQVLLEDYASQLPPAGQDYLHRIRAAAQRMSEQIDALLGLSRFLRGELRRSTVDLSALAHDIARDLAQQDAGRPVTFIIADALRANADPRLMRAVMENLLGNAWKFTAQTTNAVIEFGARPSADGATSYFVRDNGVGFDMAYAGKLFGTFQRLHTASEFPGHGIGLAIVGRVIRRHGGRVWADSQVNAGATFFFTLEGANASRAWSNATGEAGY